MLTPHRFMNFNYCLINVTAQIIDCLMQRSEASLEELLDYAVENYPEINESDITQGVSFLYLTGKINYYNTNDIVVLNTEVQ
jgi:hypothetical protein